MSKRALCVGINNYPGTHMDLSGCVNDANDWAAELTARGFSVSKLIDSQATKAAMVSGIQALIGGAVSGDVTVITYSGHGTYVPDTNGDEVDGLDEGLCPYDLQTNGEALLDDEINELFSARKAVATHPEDPTAPEKIKQFVRYGASPRGAQALIVGGKINALLEGRFNVSFEDIAAVAPATLRHRLLLNFEGLAEGISTDDIIADLLKTVVK